MPRERVEFDWNVPVTVALEYADGKLVEGNFGQQYQWTIAGNRIAWVDPKAEDQRKALGIGKGEEFRVCRRRIGKAVKWEVSRIAEEEEGELAGKLNASLALIERNNSVQSAGRIEVNHSAPQTHSHAHSTISPQPITEKPRSGKIMAGAMVAAIDAMQTAREYAASKGVDPDWDMVTRIAATLYIQHSKDSQRAAS